MAFIGHSQLNSVLNCGRSDRLPLLVISLFRGRAIPQPGSVRILWEDAKELSQEAVEWLQREPVYSFVGKRDHSALALLRHPEPWDFVAPDDPEEGLEPGAEIVPAGVLEDELSRLAKPSIGVLRRLRSVTDQPIYQFQSPPPAPTSFLEANGFPEDTVAPGALRLKTWRLYSEHVRSESEKLGIRYVPCPPEAARADGFLRDDLCINPTHANRYYGRLVLQQIEALP